MQEEKINGGLREERDPVKEAERREKWIARGRRALIEAVWLGSAWLIGRAELPFVTYPLGLAFLGASERHTVAILAGLLLSAPATGEAAGIYACAYLAAALIRLLSGMLAESASVLPPLPAPGAGRGSGTSSPDGEMRTAEKALWRVRIRTLLSGVRSIFTESLCLRMGAAGIAALLVSLYRIIVGGFRYYDLFSALVAVLVAVLATAVFSVALEQRCPLRVLRLLCEAALLWALIYGAARLSIFGIMLAPTLAFFCTLAVCYARSPWEGIVAGVLSGLAFAPIWAPAYLAAALLYLFFHSMGKENAAILVGAIGALSWMIYASGVEVLLYLLPTFLLAGAGFTLFCRVWSTGKEKAEETVDAERMGEVRYRDANERFRGISDAFSSLSEVFYNLSDRMRRPGSLDLRRVCDSAFDAVCADCPNRAVCWGAEYTNSLSSANALICALHTEGRVKEAHLPAELRERCARTDLLVHRINHECARVTEELLRNNRTEIFAMDYEGAAQIINEALAGEEEEYCFDTRLERLVSVYLSDAGVGHTGVSVFGKRCLRIFIRMADMENAHVTAETLRSDLSEMCGCELSPAVLEVENGVSSMVFRAGQRLSVRAAQKSVSADGGICGDSINLFCNKREYFYALISDGMGAGRTAALTSGLCSVFMEKMLRAGNRANTSLRMLNNMIRSRSSDSKEECSSTIDLLELDLMTGACTFFKSGAAPSFVIRGGVVRRMQSGSVPIGIMCALDSRETAFELRAGDTVIMISDGILDREGESDALITLLTDPREQERTPSELAERICETALARGEHDDCSAVVLRIEPYSRGE